MVEPVQRFFRFPFARDGDKTEISDELDPSGIASYFEGWGFDYERDPVTDPNAKRVARDIMNQLFFDITTSIRQYQQAGYPQWVGAAENGNDPLPYPYGARVRHNGLVYASVIDDNTDEPGLTVNWVIDDPFSFDLHKATFEETVGGVLDTKLITPLKFVQAVREQPYAYTTAGGTANALTAAFTPPNPRLISGLTLNVRVAQTNTGNVTLDVDGLGPVPVLGVGNTELPPQTLAPGAILTVVYNGSNFITPNLSRATKTSFGVTRYATEAEARAGTNDVISLTPAVAAQAMQSGSWTYATMGGTGAAYEATLTPSPTEINAGFTFAFYANATSAAGATIAVNGFAPVPLQWQNGAAIGAGDIVANDLVLVTRVGASFRVVNVAASSTTRRGVLRTADNAALVAATDGAAAVPASLFRSGVRETILTGLTTAANAAISAADSVLSAFGKLQAQVNARGVLAGANNWLGTNIFSAGAVYIRAAANATKMLIMQDADGTNRGMMFTDDAQNEIGLRTYAGNARRGADLKFDGTTLTLDRDQGRRFINRTETASVAEVAAMETWEKYVTPAALAGLQGVVITQDGPWTIYTIGGKMRQMTMSASSRSQGYIDLPASAPVVNATVLASVWSATGGVGARIVGNQVYVSAYNNSGGGGTGSGGNSGGGGTSAVSYTLQVTGQAA